jgi:hypothetical protein
VSGRRRDVDQFRLYTCRHNPHGLDHVHHQERVMDSGCSSDSFQVCAKSGCVLDLANCNYARLLVDEAD